MTIKEIKADDLLIMLVQKIEKIHRNVRITLNVKGLIVEGLLISEKQYLEEIKNRLHNEMGDSLDFVLEEYRYTDEDNLEESKKEFAFYIHLRDAFYYINNTPLLKGILWRGKLSEVCGFSINDDKDGSDS